LSAGSFDALLCVDMKIFMITAFHGCRESKCDQISENPKMEVLHMIGIEHLFLAKKLSSIFNFFTMKAQMFSTKAPNC